MLREIIITIFYEPNKFYFVRVFIIEKIKRIITYAMRKFTLLLLSSTLAFAGFSQANEKLLTKKWKMVKTVKDGAEVKPRHEKLTIEFLKKDNQYVVSAYLEETHRGTWSLSENGKEITLLDADTKEKKVIDVIKHDKRHLNISHYDGAKDDVVIETIPLGKEKSIHLSNTEHLLAKQWHVYESDTKENVGMLMEFKADKTFIMIPDGMKVPAVTGEWNIDEDNNKLYLDRKDSDDKIELTIVDIQTHDLILKKERTGITNKLHDKKMETDK